MLCLSGFELYSRWVPLAKKLCDMKTDRVSGTPNQIPPTNEIMPDLNHSGIYNTQNSQNTLCVRIYLNRVVRECQITNKVNKEGQRKHQSQEKKVLYRK